MNPAIAVVIVLLVVAISAALLTLFLWRRSVSDKIAMKRNKNINVVLNTHTYLIAHIMNYIFHGGMKASYASKDDVRSLTTRLETIQQDIKGLKEKPVVPPSAPVSSPVVSPSAPVSGPVVPRAHSQEQQSIPEGASIKCDANSPKIFRYENNQIHHYPTAKIASSWDPSYRNARVVDCRNIPQGAPMKEFPAFAKLPTGW